MVKSSVQLSWIFEVAVAVRSFDSEYLSHITVSGFFGIDAEYDARELLELDLGLGVEFGLGLIVELLLFWMFVLLFNWFGGVDDLLLLYTDS